MPPDVGGILFWNFQAVPRRKVFEICLHLFWCPRIHFGRSNNINVSRRHILCPCYRCYNTPCAVCQIHLVLHFFKLCL
nr:MAG TPA: transposase [Caudoviricetes sp.]